MPLLIPAVQGAREAERRDTNAYHDDAFLFEPAVTGGGSGEYLITSVQHSAGAVNTSSTGAELGAPDASAEGATHFNGVCSRIAQGESDRYGGLDLNYLSSGDWAL